ncbi:C-type lectin domain family 4 member M-like isoform X1 [Acanthopagrus latus]|uniref:C-type lectin domain family 4 member M-like isoform X1 n=2 Tax=Acanthopagrus latus TaxID=8177 RepID=UPI00187BDA2D|nr:C-type lectin domain family 4 member M-like isoform X1 [Acanthopagrus latus]
MEAMEIDDDFSGSRNLTVKGLINREDLRRRKQPSKCQTVCLGLLCTALLAGNIGQIIHYDTISRQHNPTQASFIAQADQLQSGYEAFAAEREQLEARLTNLTTERDQLQQSYNSLTTERDQFSASLNNVTTEKDLLKAIYDTLKQGSDQLKTSCNDIQRNLEDLQTNHNNLTKSRDQLQARYSTLQREKDELHTLFRQLQGNWSLLARDNDELQRSYDTLWKEKEQFKTRYETLHEENEQLQANYGSLLKVKDELQKTVDKVKRRACKTGWQKFDISCYFVSAQQKNWTSSRQECINMGADLVVIDSLDEQAFVKGMLKSGQNAWIGLTDSLTEGTWMWVDGTPVTTSYWQPGQPNSFNGNQDCGEILHRAAGVGEWNDDGCFAEQNWICEN